MPVIRMFDNNTYQHEDFLIEINQDSAYVSQQCFLLKIFEKTKTTKFNISLSETYRNHDLIHLRLGDMLDIFVLFLPLLWIY